ncbi:hypothetical protein, partial [Falsiroseomonas oryzae]|uniref:hypothetical protein n=1 Tax=Falsiroseomonas oryzae TaxID=2766473 RepID=UPI0022EBA218
MLRRILTLLVLLLCLGQGPVGAFEIPGLDSDAAAYQAELTRRMPAGGTPQQRAQAESRARAAQ